MFDSPEAAVLEPVLGTSADEPSAELSPLGVRAWKDALVDVLGAPSGLDDHARVDAIRALEELVCVATAAQAQLAGELDAAQRAVQAGAGMPAARQDRGVAAQVALARRESHHRGRRHLGLARIVAAELPWTWRAWRTGRITEWKATLIARGTACLALVDRLAVDQLIAGDAETLEAMGERELEAAVRAEATRLDPAAEVHRRRRAESQRHVSLRPAPDTMTWLTALLPVKDGVAVHAALTRAAATAHGAGDARTRGQVMADALVSRVLGGDGDAVPAPPVRLGLVMSHTALFGTSEEPGHLDGYGPIPAELARELIAHACARDEQVWLRRLYTHPATGELVSMDATTRLFRHTLARFIRLRDRTCRTPWCGAPIRHLDHVHDHAQGGATTAANAQGLCEACNHAKQAPGWRSRPRSPGGGHVIEHTTPTGHTYRSRAPALATIRTTPLHLDYVLSG